MRISDWSSDVCSSDLGAFVLSSVAAGFAGVLFGCRLGAINPTALQGTELTVIAAAILGGTSLFGGAGSVVKTVVGALLLFTLTNGFNILNLGANYQGLRSEEQTSELQSLMRI